MELGSATLEVDGDNHDVDGDHHDGDGNNHGGDGTNHGGDGNNHGGDGNNHGGDGNNHGGDGNNHDDAAPGTDDPRTRPAATYAVNASYTAFADARGVFARKLAGRDAYRRLFRYEQNRPWHEPVLAFSPLRHNLLAIATGLQILIFDVESRKLQYALKGNGRAVTCVAFGPSKPSVLATGHVDGSICVWSLKHPATPLRHLRALYGACSHVVFGDDGPDLIATCHRDCVAVWLLPSTRPVLVTKSSQSRLQSLHWFSGRLERLIGISYTGSVAIYNLHDALKALRAAAPPAAFLHDGENERPVCGELDHVACMPSATFGLAFRISQALLVGKNGLIVLPHQGRVLFFVAFMADHEAPTELWRLRLDAQVDCFTLRCRADSVVEVVACCGTEAHAYKVPVPVLDGMGWTPGGRVAGAQHARDLKESDQDSSEPGLMRPELSLYQRIAKPPSLPMPTTIESSPQPLHPPTPRKKAPKKVLSETSRSATPTPQSMTSSLELPKPQNEPDEHHSPMPFLSPSIPARKSSPAPLLPPLDEIARMPPRASIDPAASFLHHDSDSDDETFAEIMQGSASFLPGGVIVPLPRTCGASFAPSAQLLTFFPSKTTPSFLFERADAEYQIDLPNLQSREVLHLFQGFGNFMSPAVARRDSISSEMECAVDTAQHVIPLESPEGVGCEPHLAWSAKLSPANSGLISLPAQQKVIVAVRELRTGLQTHRLLAEQYRILPDRQQTISDVCRMNADAADQAELEDVADLWRHLALIVEAQSATRPMTPSAAGEWPCSDLYRRPIISRDPSMASNYSACVAQPVVTRLAWSRHPLGKNWAVVQVLQWVEQQADIQLLAHVSALLIHASQALEDDLVVRDGHVDTKNVLTGDESTEFASTRREPSTLPLGIPILRSATDLTDATMSDDFLVNPRSQASSTEPSQPTTPYLDSSSSTPPLGLPYFHRQGTKLSTSGSISPDTQRTSFSSAAKHYAPTITDKPSSYGSPPRSRKFQNRSPSTNDLSSSLPKNTPGSWSKSVSFASATDAARNSQRSLSLAQEDDDHDSDKTIDDASLPHTPRPSGGVSVRSLGGLFWDEPATSLRSAFLPDEQIETSQVWRDAYAEQLRAWDMLLEAAELENITDHRRPSPPENPAAHSHVAPHIEEGRRNAMCSICFCMIEAAEQVCFACLHTTHTECLDGLLMDLDDLDFTCPTGCGCDCTAVPDVQHGPVLETGRRAQNV